MTRATPRETVLIWLTWLGAGAVACIAIAVWIACGYVAWHFVAKYW